MMWNCKRIIGGLLAIFFLPLVYAQKIPADGDTLNFTSVCFTYPWRETADQYTLVLKDLVSNKTITENGVGNKIVINNLTAGHAYQWHVVSKKDGHILHTSDSSSFYISVYSHPVRYRFVKNDTENRSNSLVILDYAHSAINRDAEVVWYLPGIQDGANIRDLKMTDAGTFTYIKDSNAVEIDLQGNILWKAPDNGTVSHMKRENYHHNLTKQPNGNYLVLGSEFKKFRVPTKNDSIPVEMGTIIEYLPNGTVDWEWHSTHFFKDEWIPFEFRNDRYTAMVHMNAVYSDGVYVYAGFRDMGWIVKIEKSSKKVVAIYGGKKSGLPYHYAQGMFRFQHDALPMKDGSFAVLNNDSVADPKVVSSVILFSEGKNPGEKIFDFPLNYDGSTSGKSMKLGSINELPNGNLLVNMGAINRIFEVTRDKKVVWDVWIEKYDSFKKVWGFFSQYRAASTSSLYPNEFCVKIDKNSEKKNQYDCFLLNVGSEANAYRIMVEHDGKLLELAQTETLLPNKTLTQKLRLPPNSKTVTVEVIGKSKKELLALPH